MVDIILNDVFDILWVLFILHNAVMWLLVQFFHIEWKNRVLCVRADIWKSLLKIQNCFWRALRRQAVLFFLRVQKVTKQAN